MRVLQSTPQSNVKSLRVLETRDHERFKNVPTTDKLSGTKVVQDAFASKPEEA